MSDSPVDSSKRTWIITSACAGAVGGVAAAVPFVSSFQPSERAKAAGLTAHLITDAGDTEFGGVPTVTALGIGPHFSSKLAPVTGELKLL